MINKQLRVCPDCYDTPQQQLRTPRVNYDPRSVDDARPEPYLVDEVNELWLRAVGVGTPMFSATSEMQATLSNLGKLLFPDFAATSDMNAALVAGLTLAAALDAAGSMSASLMRGLDITAALAGVSDMAAALHRGITMTAAIDGASDMSAALQRGVLLAASIDGASAMSGALSVTHFQIITTTGAGSFTVPAGVTSIRARGLGGGGTGGNNAAIGGGGGGAAYADTTAISVTPGNTVWYSVGAAAADTWLSAASNAPPASTTNGVLAKGGANGSGSQNSTSTFTPAPAASAAFKDVLARANAAVSDYNPDTARTVAGFTAPQMQAFAQIAGNQGIWAPHLDAATGMTGAAGQGIAAADISKFYNPYQSDVIDATLARIRDEDAMATRAYTANQVAQGGLGGNGFGIGRAQLAGDQAQARNAVLANLRNTGWREALAAAQTDKMRGLAAGQQMAGIGALGSQLGYTDAGQMLAAGNQQQQQAQNQFDTAAQNTLNEQLWPMQQAQWLSGIAAGIGPLLGGTTKSKGTATQSQGKGAGNVLGAGLTLASMASDERVKERPIKIGRTHDGQPIYEFNYVGDPRRQIGLMAQEVEEEHPEAVSRGVGGIKMVNYDRALAGARRAHGGRLSPRTQAAIHRASGGRIGLPEGLIGWAELRPGRTVVPEPMEVRAPSTPKDEFDPQAAFDLGKKAAGGIGNIARLLDPAGGWGAEIVPTASLGGAGGGIGALNLASLLGFADGGTPGGIPSFASRVASPAQPSPAGGGTGGIAPGLAQYLAPSRAALDRSLTVRQPVTQAAPVAAVPTSSGKGMGLPDIFSGMLGQFGDVLGGAFGHPELGDTMREPFANMSFADGGGIASFNPVAGIGNLSRVGIMGRGPFADGGLIPTDEELRAIEMQESGGREDAVSPKGARGPMQVMPDTARDPGFGVTPLRDNSAAENRRFGRDYYAAMLRRYGGNRAAARIAYNGGPARADAWLKAGRDDSVIPAESVNYYKQVAGRMGGGEQPATVDSPADAVGSLVARGKGGDGPAGEPYRSRADRATGGMLKRALGIDFNPLNLTEPERRALMVAGLSMMSSGNIGQGALSGMQYLSGVEVGERERASEAAKLSYQMKKDADELKLKAAQPHVIETTDEFGRVKKTPSRFDLKTGRYEPIVIGGGASPSATGISAPPPPSPGISAVPPPSPGISAVPGIQRDDTPADRAPITEFLGEVGSSGISPPAAPTVTSAPRGDSRYREMSVNINTLPKSAEGFVYDLGPNGLPQFDAQMNPKMIAQKELETRSTLDVKRGEAELAGKRQASSFGELADAARANMDIPGFEKGLAIARSNFDASIPVPGSGDSLGFNTSDVAVKLGKRFDQNSPAWAAYDQIVANQRGFELAATQVLMAKQGSITENERKLIREASNDITGATSRADYAFRINKFQRMMDAVTNPDYRDGDAARAAASSTAPTVAEIKDIYRARDENEVDRKIADLAQKYRVGKSDMGQYVVNQFEFIGGAR